MSNSIFLLDNQSDSAAITASTEVITAGNVQNIQRSKVWRSDTGTSSYLDITLSDVFGIGYIALVDLNLSNNGLIRIQAWSDSLDGVNVVLDTSVSPTLYVSSESSSSAFGLGDFGLGSFGADEVLTQLSNRNITLIPLNDVLLVQYYRITFSDDNTTYQQLGRLWMGGGITFQNNLSYGWSAERIERTVSRETIGGQRYVQPRDSKLKITGKFSWLSEDERTLMLIRLQQLGESTPFIFSLFPENNNQGLTTTLYCTFNSKSITQLFQNQNEFNFSVTEEL